MVLCVEHPVQNGVDAVPDTLFFDIAVGWDYTLWDQCGWRNSCWEIITHPWSCIWDAPGGLQLSKVAVGLGFACGLSSGGRLMGTDRIREDLFRGPVKRDKCLGIRRHVRGLWANSSELARAAIREIDCFGSTPGSKMFGYWEYGTTDYSPFSETVLLNLDKPTTCGASSAVTLF